MFSCSQIFKVITPLIKFILKDSKSIAVILADGTVLRKTNAIKHVLKKPKNSSLSF